jgi:hypothetical protein
LATEWQQRFRFVSAYSPKMAGRGNKAATKQQQGGNGVSTRNFPSRYCVWDWHGSNPRISIIAVGAILIDL